MKSDLNYKEEFHRSRGEELTNGITHVIGALLGVAVLSISCVFAALNHSACAVTCCSLFGAMLVFLYTSSSVYHFVVDYKAKAFFQLMDHISIYLLIAGSYMPYSLLAMSPTKGWVVFGIEWGLALVGIIGECLLSRRLADILSLPIFIGMGWMLLIDFAHIHATIPTSSFWLLVSGGISYMLGIVFYLMDKVPYMHSIWHLLVLGGSVCHGLSVILFMA
ncbi:MAG: hemolysin III family protein [Victivallales bacterium]|nr:hemolysin III family protein [Victivallales bacterium]